MWWKLAGFDDSTSSRVENELKMICRRWRRIRQKCITVIKFGMNKNSGIGTSNSLCKALAQKIAINCANTKEVNRWSF
jgi:hypothetical protein